MLHRGFKQMALRLAKSTENLGHDGYNNLLSEREYQLKMLTLAAVEDEVIAIAIHDGTYDDGEDE